MIRVLMDVVERGIRHHLGRVNSECCGAACGTSITTDNPGYYRCAARYGTQPDYRVDSVASLRQLTSFIRNGCPL